MDTKICSKCTLEKSVDEFPKRETGKPKSICYECNKIYQKTRYHSSQEIRDKQIAQVKAAQARNPKLRGLGRGNGRANWLECPRCGKKYPDQKRLDYHLATPRSKGGCGEDRRIKHKCVIGYDAQLGRSTSTATHELRKRIMFDFLCKLGLNRCFRCGGEMSVSDFSIDHKTPWRGEADDTLFWDLDNISFSHNKCNGRASRPRILNKISEPV